MDPKLTQAEGFVLCVGAKMFTIAGPVIVYGVGASDVYFIAEDGGAIRNLSRQLVNEFYMRDEQGDVMINAYLVQILISLYRILTNSVVAKEKSSSSTSNFAVY